METIWHYLRGEWQEIEFQYTPLLPWIDDEVFEKFLTKNGFYNHADIFMGDHPNFGCEIYAHPKKIMVWGY